MVRYTLVFLVLAAATALVWIARQDLASPSDRTESSFANPVETSPRPRGGENAPPTGPREPSVAGPTAHDAGQEDETKEAEALRPPLAAEEHAPRAPDFEELLTAYDSVAAATLEAFNARYAGAIAFRSAGEFAWMEEHGFPLPEEILAATEMPLAELRKLADGGDQGARFLYLDRTLQAVRELRQSYLRSGISPDALRDIPEYADALIRVSYAKGLITGSDSPFAGYLMAEFSRAAFGDSYGYMAGLLHASHMGDPRAYGKLRSFVQQNGICESALHAMGAYAVIVEGQKVMGDPQ